jgi:phage tail-like protein
MATQIYVTKAANDPDPVPLFKFWVEMENIVVAEFKECSGLSIEREVEQRKEGGVNDYVHLLPGRLKYTNITLKHGIADPDTSTTLWKWFQEGMYDGKVKRVNLSILLRNVEGEVVQRWSVTNAYPVKWQGPQFNTESSQVAIETLELAHHGLKLGE